APLVHAETGRAVQRKHVQLGERAWIQKPLDALTCGQLALRVLRALGCAAAVDRVVATLAQHVDLALGRAALLSDSNTVAFVDARTELGGIEVRRISSADRRHALSRCPGHERRLTGLWRAAGSIHNTL